MKDTILIVDDEPSIRDSLRGTLEDANYTVESAATGEEALSFLKGEGGQDIDVMLLDVWLPGIDGIEVLKATKANRPDLPVVMISGHGTIDTAVQSTKFGAYHFIEKPFSEDVLLLTLSHALREARLEKENVRLKHDVRRNQHEILGNSAAFKALMDQISRAGASEAWVLIHGENGTGKESVAQLVHQNSPRKDGPFVEVNCAAIPEELIESELFGHEKGSFTGATARKIGKFDQAHQGTLFLDEIADMSLKTQAKILRVLQEQRFERVGGNREIQVDVRVIAASNKKLEVEIEEGRFREDLYYRLNVLPLEVPPLRDRKGDVELLVPFFLKYFGQLHGRKPKKIAPEALAILAKYEWPGNVRELKNTVERMMIMVPEETIQIQDISPGVLQAVGQIAPVETASESREPNDTHVWSGTFREAKESFERSYLTAQLNANKWNVSKTAEQIQLERSNLHKKIKQLNLQQP